MSEQLIQTPGVFGENGNFLLERALGEGGMGGVYLGRDKMLDRPVAVKVMLKSLGDDPEFVERFKREAQAAARLIHPNIAQIYSYGISDGMPYIAMELVAGGSLDQIMKNAADGKTDVTRVMKICEQIAQALRCAADQGLVHGDVKPENVLLDSNGNAKLVDFGLAAMQKDTDEIWGTPYYIAPEKVRKGEVDFRADMYSLGGTLYHALTGVAPFEGEDANAVVKKRFEGAPRKPSEVRPGLSPQIDALVMKMLAENREDRFPSFEALLEEFRKVLTSGLSATAPVAATTSAAPSGKKPMMVRGRRMMLKRKTAAPAEGADEVPELESEEDEKPKKSKLKRKSRYAYRDESEEDEEENEGSIGGKVALVVIGVILVIGAVVGGLIWYKVASDRAEAESLRQQIHTGIENARGAIVQTRSVAEKFADEFDTFSEKAIIGCTKAAESLGRQLPEFKEALHPGPSKELLDAIASTNAAVAATNAVAEAKAGTNAVKVVEGKAEKPKRKFRKPTEDESDPNSPEYEKYQEEKKKFEEELAKESEKPEEKPTEEAAEPEEPKKEPPQEIKDFAEVWERAYGCKACAIRIRVKVAQLVKEAEKADEIKGETRENMEALAELSRKVKDLSDEITGSKDVETVRKGIAWIESRGKKIQEALTRRLRTEMLEKQRQEKKEREAKEEAERKAKIEQERRERAEREQKEAKDKFEAIAGSGMLKQLDWKGALRQLDALKNDFKSPEGEIAVEFEKSKINYMKMVQDIFIYNAGGYVFKRAVKESNIKGRMFIDADENDIRLQDAENKRKIHKLTWKKFYEKNHANLNELIIKYIEKGRGTTKLDKAGKERLSLKAESEALLGTALTLRIICGDNPTAAGRGEQIIKNVVKAFPDYLKKAEAMFPDIKFEAATEEE